MTTPSFELFSHNLCPYVQRAVITLTEKSISHRRTYVDLANKPAWFREISPLGRVPLLRTGNAVIFESAVICEYLDEVETATPMLPKDPVLRARDRAWFAFASEDLFGPSYRIQYAGDKETVDEQTEKLLGRLSRLNDELKGRDYLSGDGKTFGMADVFGVHSPAVSGVWSPKTTPFEV